jgi:hypothetical protein
MIYLIKTLENIFENDLFIINENIIKNKYKSKNNSINLRNSINDLLNISKLNDNIYDFILPNEITIMIFNYFEWKELMVISKTCKEWRRQLFYSDCWKTIIDFRNFRNPQKFFKLLNNNVFNKLQGICLNKNMPNTNILPEELKYISFGSVDQINSIFINVENIDIQKPLNGILIDFKKYFPSLKYLTFNYNHDYNTYNILYNTNDLINQNPFHFPGTRIIAESGKEGFILGLEDNILYFAIYTPSYPQIFTIEHIGSGYEEIISQGINIYY